MHPSQYQNFPNIAKLLNNMENSDGFCAKIGAVLSGDPDNHTIPHIKVEDDETFKMVKDVITGSLKDLVMFIEPQKRVDISTSIRMVVLTNQAMIHDPAFKKLDEAGLHFMILEKS